MPKISEGAVLPLKSAVILSVAGLAVPFLSNAVSANYQYQALSPMTRHGYDWTLYIGGGIDANGYFYKPPLAQQVWGVQLRDGFYSAPAGWEDNAPINLTFEIQNGHVIRQDWDFSQARPKRSWFGF